MHLSDFLIFAVGILAVLLTAAGWVRVTRKVHTEEHPVVPGARANDDPARIAY